MRKAKIFVTGDVHGDPISRLSTKNFPEGKDLTRDDIVIITGDFGVFFCQDDEDDVKRQKYALAWLDRKPFTTLFIGGNHENWDTLNDLPLVDKYGVKMGQASEHVFFIPNGTIFEFGGRKIFCFGGAMSTDKDYRERYEREHGRKIWWEDEIPSQPQMQSAVDALDAVNWKVDVVITHTMSSECVSDYVFYARQGELRVADPVARFLSFIQPRLTYDKWYCGHFHVNKEFTNKETNQKIMVLYDYIVNPDDEPLKHYGRVWISPLW